MNESLLSRFETPIVICREMSDADVEVEVAKYRLRQAATLDFLDGHIGAGDWLDTLDECDYDPAIAVRDWTEGINYMES